MFRNSNFCLYFVRWLSSRYVRLMDTSLWKNTSRILLSWIACYILICRDCSLTLIVLSVISSSISELISSRLSPILKEILL